MPNNMLPLAESLRGMSPEQAAQATQLAVQALQNRQAQQQQSQQFTQEMKLKKVEMALQQRAEKKRLAITKQKADAYDQMATAQRLNAETSYENARQSARSLEMKERLLDSLRNSTFTLEDGKEISGLTAAAMASKDIPVNLAGPDKVIETLADEEGNVKALVQRKGKLEVTEEFEDLRGFERMPSKETEVYGPGEKAEARTIGTQRAKVKTDEWAKDFVKNFRSINPEAHRKMTRGKDKETILEGKRVARERAAETLATIHDVPEVRFGKFNGRIGFWKENENGELEYIRGDI